MTSSTLTMLDRQSCWVERGLGELLVGVAAGTKGRFEVTFDRHAAAHRRLDGYSVVTSRGYDVAIRGLGEAHKPPVRRDRGASLGALHALVTRLTFLLPARFALQPCTEAGGLSFTLRLLLHRWHP